MRAPGLCKQALDILFLRPMSTESVLNRAPLSQFRQNGTSSFQRMVDNLHRLSSRSVSSSSQHQEKTASTKILYDGECRLCSVEIAGLKKISSRKADVVFVDITSPGYDASKYEGVTYEDAMKEMHVIGPDGQVYTQGDAIRQMYRACGLGWLASATELPGVKPVCDRLYIRFAEYRLRNALDKCDSGSCSIKLQRLREKMKESEVRE